MLRCSYCLVALLLLLPLPVRAQDMPLSQILIDGEGWREVAHGLKPIHNLETKKTGEVLIRHGKGLDQINLDGTVKYLGPQEPDALRPMVETKSGYRYSVSPEKGVILLHGKLPKGEAAPPKEMKVPGLETPSCLVPWADHGTLVAGDAGGKHLWAFRIDKDGSLSAGDRYYPLRMRPGEKASGVTAMTIDAKGRLYACTPLGVQVFDPTGRLCGLLLTPTSDTPTAIVFGGEGFSSLHIAAGEKVFARKLQPKAASSP